MIDLDFEGEEFTLPKHISASAYFFLPFSDRKR
jgi:hypothetical protein